MTWLPASTLRHFPAGAPDPATSEGRGALTDDNGVFELLDRWVVPRGLRD